MGSEPETANHGLRVGARRAAGPSRALRRGVRAAAPRGFPQRFAFPVSVSRPGPGVGVGVETGAARPGTVMGRGAADRALCPEIPAPCRTLEALGLAWKACGVERPSRVRISPHPYVPLVP